MSAEAHVAVLGSGRVERRSGARAAPAGRPFVTLLAFGLLGLYGILRWATMLAAPPLGRMLGLVALSIVIAALGGVAHSRERAVRIAATVAIVIGSLAVFPLSGFPLHWALHLQIARIADAISNGIAALPLVIVPYHSRDPWTTAVIVLGAGLLLLGGALTLASSRRPVGEARLAGAALPMVVLAIVPSSLTTPQLAYVHGAVLFILLAALVFSERVPAGRGMLAGCVVVVAAIGGAIVAPSLEERTPWLSVETLTGTIGPARVGEAFNWSQNYGPLDWPHNGTVVLDVRARFPTYWKAEDLDAFDSNGWVAAAVNANELAAQATIRPANITRWSQTLTVSLREMTSDQVIAAGFASEPSVTGVEPTPIANLEAGAVPGTWITTRPLEPGDTYAVNVYTPEPTAREMAHAGDHYPFDDLRSELEMSVPPTGITQSVIFSHLPAQPVQFAPYGSSGALQGYAGMTPAQETQLLQRGPYARVYALAQRLKRGTHTPYAYVEAVMRFLSHGYTYDLSPPVSRYPIVTFLFGDKLGYCQQFAGAMALLLRMGGVPARVAAGFATGYKVPGTNEYLVDDRDAHAWVEAWFPRYGWVKFDPTPGTSLRGPIPAAALSAAALKSGASQASKGPVAHGLGPNAAVGRGRHARAGGSSELELVLALVLALAFALVLSGGVLWVLGARRAGAGGQALLDELERAFARCGRPLAREVTLAELERRTRDTPDAAGYIRAIRLARFAPQAAPPTVVQRRAMRRQLRAGLGILGGLRALLALPPYRSHGRTVPDRRAGA